MPQLTSHAAVQKVSQFSVQQLGHLSQTQDSQAQPSQPGLSLGMQPEGGGAQTKSPSTQLSPAGQLPQG